MKWINVKTRLPKNNDMVLVWYCGFTGWRHGIAFLEHGRLVRCSDGADICPTHWMPLPEPPAQQSKGEQG